jgi:hypothetical protein
MSSKTRFSRSSISSMFIFSPIWYARAAFVAFMIAIDSCSRSGSHASRHCRSYCSFTYDWRSPSRAAFSFAHRCSISTLRCAGVMSSEISCSCCSACSAASSAASLRRRASSDAASAARTALNRACVRRASIPLPERISHSARAPTLKLSAATSTYTCRASSAARRFWIK